MTSNCLAASWGDWWRVLSLQDHNTRVVVGGAVLLGLAAGVIGSFTLLRKRALMGDALSHATLPGIAGAFIIAVAIGGSGARSLAVLLMGAAFTGILGVATLLFLRRYTRIKDDTALGVVLSVFFGLGIGLLGIVQKMGVGSAAGLEGFIYGKTASMVPRDVLIIAVAGAFTVACCAVLFKEFKLLCFDQAYAASLGLPVLLLDVAMMGLVVLVTVVGLQAVGLILIIALLIIPAAAARFWADRTLAMTVLAAVIGGLSAMLGAMASALYENLPSGAIIVIVAAGIFGISMLLGTARGVLPRWLRQRDLNRRVGRQHLLRAMYELAEDAAAGGVAGGAVERSALLAHRTWTTRQLDELIGRARGDELLDERGRGGAASLELTERGAATAARMVRNHRLWEMYLITHADIAPSHVDRDADMIEHVLAPTMIEELERLLAADDARAKALPMPESPHAIAAEATP